MWTRYDCIDKRDRHSDGQCDSFIHPQTLYAGSITFFKCIMVIISYLRWLQSVADIYLKLFSNQIHNYTSYDSFKSSLTKAIMKRANNLNFIFDLIIVLNISIKVSTNELFYKCNG